MPRLSVIMPMYNSAKYVGEAIESIINQTFQDWELLVINDSSTDQSPDIVREYAAKDNRIKLIDNLTGLKGEGPARNCGLDNAAGEYIAMMDSDDISLPNRLEEQVGFMDKNPRIALSGCWMQTFGASNRVWWSPPFDWSIKALLCFNNQPCGATIIFRRDTINDRYQQIPFGTDAIFIVKACLAHPVANLCKKLYLYRIHPESVTYTSSAYNDRKVIFLELLPLRFGFVPTPEQIDMHLALIYKLKIRDRSIVIDRLKWISYILIHGKITVHEKLIIALWSFYRFLKDYRFILSQNKTLYKLYKLYKQKRSR